ncbi:MAG: metallophosphoesterase [Candidatus Omnitrophica bacterium]|nr:metallophosphoesterase [Candidatus Omnitrophota bacterium]
MVFISMAYADKNTSASHLRTLALLERERKVSVETMIRKKIVQLEELITRIEQDALPNTAMIGDQHGENDVFGVLIQAVKDGSVDEVIVEGDVFDRGGHSVENFEALKELKELLGEKAVFCLGNHEIFLIQAILLNNEYVHMGWMLPNNGGQAFLDECRQKQRDPREIAMWVLKNFKLFHIDERVFMDIHAGIPIDVSGGPLISREQLDGWQGGWEAIQQSIGKVYEPIEPSQIEALERLFKAAKSIFWVDDSGWASGFEEWAIGEDDADGHPEYTNVVLKGTIDKTLTMLGLNGVVSAHVLRAGVRNIDNRILGINVLADEDGFLVFDKAGMVFNGKDGSTEQIASKEEILVGIEGEIIRLKRRLGESTAQDEVRLAMREAAMHAEPPEAEPVLSLKSTYELMEELIVSGI